MTASSLATQTRCQARTRRCRTCSPPNRYARASGHPGARVVVYDTDGYYVAPGVAELLAADGFEVTVVTTFAVLVPGQRRDPGG